MKYESANYVGNVIACAACGERVEDLTGHTCQETAKQAVSYKPEVIADSSGKFVGNSLRFATFAEADANVRNLFSRWTSVREFRVVESNEPVNYRWVDGKGLEAVQS
jgi:hypothetical protein